MYAELFQLSVDPFKATADAHLRFDGGDFAAARADLARLLRGGAGICVLSSPPGMGKTTLLRALAADLNAAGAGVSIALCNRWRRAAELLLTARQAAGAEQAVVLLLDEAQDLPEGELAGLLDEVAAGGLALLAAGQPRIEAAVLSRLPSGIAPEAVGIRRLRPLTSEEVIDYITGRLLAAGCAPTDVFTEAALAAVAARTGGVPRLVDRTCSTALFLAALDDCERVEARHVERAAESLESTASPSPPTSSRALVPVTEAPVPARLILPPRPQRGGFDPVLAAGAAASLAAAICVGALFWHLDRARLAQLAMPAEAAPAVAAGEAPVRASRPVAVQPTASREPAVVGALERGTLSVVPPLRPANEVDAMPPVPPLPDPPLPPPGPVTAVPAPAARIDGAATVQIGAMEREAVPLAELSPAAGGDRVRAEGRAATAAAVAANAALHVPPRAQAVARVGTTAPVAAGASLRLAPAGPEAAGRAAAADGARRAAAIGLAGRTLSATTQAAVAAGVGGTGTAALRAPAVPHAVAKAEDTPRSPTTWAESAFIAPVALTEATAPDVAAPEGGPESPVRIGDPSVAEEIQALLAQAERQIGTLNLTTPAGDNALETYRRILALAPGHPAATEGIERVGVRYVDLSRSATRRGRGGDAAKYAEKAESLAPDHPRVLDLIEQRRLQAAIEERIRIRALRPRDGVPLSADAIADSAHLRRLLEAGADAEVRFSDGHTPLTLAAQQSRTDAVRLLLRAGVDPNSAAESGGSALMYAAWNGDAEGVGALLLAGAWPDMQNVDGKTALMAAAINGHREVASLLLRAGADPNVQSFNGWTALMYAVWGMHEDVLALILRHGGDPHVVNGQGLSAAELAAERQASGISRRLATVGD